MKCDNCKAESKWLEIVGKQFICHKCLAKHKLMGTILRTHQDTFTHILKKLKTKDFQEYLRITEEDIDRVAELKKHGIDKPKKKN